MALDAELRFFDEHRDELLTAHAGKFAVVKAQELAGVYDTEQAAYETGVSQFGNEPFLVKQILPIDPVQSLPALYTGLVALHN